MNRLALLLGPSPDELSGLRATYSSAIEGAVELIIASAYLTEWNSVPALPKSVKRADVLIGTDFGISRKSAMTKLCSWLEKREGTYIGAVTELHQSGFHPKVLAWRNKSGRCYVLVGSANLSKAAFERNVEASVVAPVSETQFTALKQWVSKLKKSAETIDPDWIEHQYKESKLRKPKDRPGRQVPPLVILPTGDSYRQAVRRRRKNQKRIVALGQSYLDDTKVLLQCLK